MVSVSREWYSWTQGNSGGREGRSRAGVMVRRKW